MDVDTIIKASAVVAAAMLFIQMTYQRRTEPVYIEELIEAPLSRGRSLLTGRYGASNPDPTQGASSSKQAYEREIQAFYQRMRDREYEMEERPWYRTTNDVLYRNIVGFRGV